MRLYRPTRPPVNAQSAQKGSPSMGAGTKRLRGGPFRPCRTHHPWLPLQGSWQPKADREVVSNLQRPLRLGFAEPPPLEGEAWDLRTPRASPMRGSCRRRRLRRWTMSPGRKCSHLIRHGSAVPPSPHRGRLGCRQPRKKVQAKFVGLHLFCGLIFTHSIAIAVVFGSCFGALFGIESCRMPFSNFARISFGSRPSPT